MTAKRHEAELQVLVGARRQLEAQACWSQGAEARKRDGTPVSFDHPRAGSWSLVGALWRGAKVESIADYAPAHLAKERLERHLAEEGDCRRDTDAAPTLQQWNDHPRTTHDDAKALLDRVILLGQTGRWEP